MHALRAPEAIWPILCVSMAIYTWLSIPTPLNRPRRVQIRDQILPGPSTKIGKWHIFCSFLKDKSLRAVIEFLPEAANETTTVEQDRSFVESVATAMGNSGVQFDSIKRHGNKVENRHRILKVPFDTTENRNQFIRKFRVTVNTLQNPPNVRIRRDMVQSELELLRQCRAECREKNEKANEMRFYVQDLEIKEAASPKPLRR
ncbi:hypothetical protein DdX_20298 [Ditylenchus destructor]|uniref:Uncharacterized protein n=1 Tax=Ditylenchus destructor TaxID=166010 RepID=A0AAD4QWH7_9BILA|nr:hypothetical protein DdX_20298 [Ditylenchus destructor]